MMKENRTVVVSVQVIPLMEDCYSLVDKAIEAIHNSNLKYIVTPLETVIEGTLDECIAAARAAHDAAFAAGAVELVTFIKISDKVQGSTIDHKLEKYR